jgi:hypothetical protein
MTSDGALVFGAGTIASSLAKAALSPTTHAASFVRSTCPSDVVEVSSGNQLPLYMMPSEAALVWTHFTR